MHSKTYQFAVPVWDSMVLKEWQSGNWTCCDVFERNPRTFWLFRPEQSHARVLLSIQILHGSVCLVQLPDKSISSLVKYFYSWKKTRSRTSLMDRHAKKRACQRDGGSEAGSEAGSNNSDEDIDMKDVRRDLFDAVCFLKVLAMVLMLTSMTVCVLVFRSVTVHVLVFRSVTLCVLVFRSVTM